MKIALGISLSILLLSIVMLVGACSVTLYFIFFDTTPWKAKLFQYPFLIGFILTMLGLTRLQLRRVIRLVRECRDLEAYEK